MLMDIKPAVDRQGLINLSAAIEADATRIEALGECILETICDPAPGARQIATVDALASVIKIMAERVASTAAKVESFATTLPEETTA